MASYVTPKKNTAFIFYLGLPSAADASQFQANPTLAAGDVQVSIDGGTLANLTTLPTVTPAAGKMVKVSLSAAEMNGDNIAIVFSDQTATEEWNDVIANIQTSARQIDDLAFPNTSGRGMVVDAAGLVDSTTVKMGPTGAGTAQTARDIGTSVLISSGTGTGQLSVAAGVISANVATAGAFAQAAADKVWATAARLLTAGTNIVLAKGTGVTGFNDLSAAQVNAEADTAIADAALATAANLAIVAGYLDTEIAAIKAKTDNLPSDPADQSLIIAATDALATLIGDVPTNAELTTALGTADDSVLAQIALVKAKTDSLTFTVAGQIDSNVQYVNDVEVTGNGQPGTEWGP